MTTLTLQTKCHLLKTQIQTIRCTLTTQSHTMQHPCWDEQFRKTVLECGFASYRKGSLNVLHNDNYWSYYMHILPKNNLNCFPAITEENIEDFSSRLHVMHQDLLHIGRASFKGAIVEVFNISWQTNRNESIIGIAVVEELMSNWQGSTLSCLQLNWANIHSLNTENS